MAMGKIGIAFVLVHLTGFASLGQAADPGERFKFTSVHMGTEWMILLYAPNEAAAQKAVQLAWDRVKQLDGILSDYNPKSELMQLCEQNDARPGQPVKVSEDLFRVLELGQTIAEKSEGRFDMTVGPLVKLWRTARKTKELPDAKALAAAKELVGYAKIQLDAKSQTVALNRAGMRLDFGGIGKGYAADAALAVLKKQGFNRVLIAASGDITVGDPPPGRENWLITIEPLGKDQPAKYLTLKNASVSTSGDLFQSVEIAGVRYSHVLDPQTGLGLTGRRSATVVAPSGWLADALTKAVSVLPSNRGVKLIDGVPGAAMYLAVKENDEAKIVETTSKLLGDYLLKETTPSESPRINPELTHAKP
jgi:thiamine biosynthesis lipoprotein